MRKSSILTILCLALFSTDMTQAQSGVSKDASFAFYLGAGHERQSDTYSSGGFSMNATGRLYTSDRLFFDMTVHWGNHEGEKEVMQGDKPAKLSDERNTLLAAVGPGFDLYQNGDNTLSIFARALAGYGVRQSRYDDYDPDYGENGLITSYREKTQKGIAAIAGVGVDLRYKRWILSPAVDVIYAGKAWTASATLSVGYYY